MGFEVWYYIVFGLVTFLPTRWRKGAVVIWLALVGPRIALAFPIWLMGYFAYAVSKKRLERPWLGSALFVATVLIYLPFHMRLGQPFGLQNQFNFNAAVLRGYSYY